MKHNERTNGHHSKSQEHSSHARVWVTCMHACCTNCCSSCCSYLLRLISSVSPRRNNNGTTSAWPLRHYYYYCRNILIRFKNENKHENESSCDEACMPWRCTRLPTTPIISDILPLFGNVPSNKWWVPPAGVTQKVTQRSSRLSLLLLLNPAVDDVRGGGGGAFVLE